MLERVKAPVGGAIVETATKEILFLTKHETKTLLPLGGGMVVSHGNSGRRATIWDCTRCGTKHVSPGWYTTMRFTLGDCEAGEIVSMLATSRSWYARRIARDAAFLKGVPTPLLGLALLCLTPNVSFEIPENVIAAIGAICPTMRVDKGEEIRIRWPTMFTRARSGAPPTIVSSSHWKLIDSGTYGALISHPSFIRSWSSERRFYVRSTIKVALLPDVSLKGVGYAIRVHPLVKTVEAARRYIYRLPRRAKFVREV